MYIINICHDDTLKIIEYPVVTKNKKHLIKIPSFFWTSVAGLRAPLVEDLNSFPYTTKEPLFESMFSIIIENSRVHNYFSEKIIDAFSTFTVPIYFGCPNLNDFFDGSGVIQVDSVDELVDKVNSLQVGDYWNSVSSMSNNFNISRLYINFAERLRAVIFDKISSSRFLHR